MKPVSKTKWVATANSIAERAEQGARRRGDARAIATQLFGVVEALHPVELRVDLDEIVEHRERDLRVAELVEGAEGRRGPPRRVAAEARAAEVADDGGELGERQRRAVQLDRVPPNRVELLEVVDRADRLAHRGDRRLLLGLAVHVLGVRSAKRLFPRLPRVVREPRLAALLAREDLFFAHVGKLPVELPRLVEPLAPLEHDHSRSS